ncbi:hypothetical protein K1719_008922 [Acacia pycnantha]|nr:hypothetical protein K1719_008922 [Acacia pycnantha]
MQNPCGHNFCLKFFQKWTGLGKNMYASRIRIISALVSFVRKAKASRVDAAGETSRGYQFVHNQDRPDRAYTPYSTALPYLKCLGTCKIGLWES